MKRTGRLKAAKRPPLLRSSRRAAHTHCFCGGSVNAGDHTSHQDVTYTACTRANSLRQIFNIEKVNVAYAYLENDITLDDDLRILGDSDQRGKTLYLCLNGHTLNLGQYFIWVGYMDCTLYLCDCSAQKTGTVSGGSKGCVSVDDAGNYNATFNMYSGTLRGGNRTGCGGGVEIVNGTMNMYGGTITENTATSDGGGIYVGTKGALNLYGGTITGNKVNTNEAHHGGGVYVESNLWSGVGKISISGSPVITGNTRTYTPDSATTTENLYLGYGFTNSGDLPIITLGTVASGANIGISAKKTVFSTASDTDYSGYFSSDDTGYHVEYNADKKLELKSGAAHVHTGGTAYCNKKAVCTTCDKEYGNLDPTNHSAPKPNEWQGDDKEHWQVYSCCNAIINKAAHVGGKATCKDRAVCTTCGAAYGGLGAHSFTEKVAEQYLKSAATCTAKAVYYKSCTFCGEKGTETFETGNVLDHDWDEPSYTWTAVTDGYMCVASGKCKNCDADVSDIATVTYAVKKAPTCLNAGTGTYTATFSAAYGFPAQTKDVLLPAIGHTWGTATYTWTQTETGYTCTAKRVCENDAAHVESETVTGDYSVITEPTCLAAGLGRYQVSFKADWAKDASKDVSIPALGHDWGEWVTSIEPTVSTVGYRYHVCNRDGCGYREGEDIPKLHTHTWDAGVVTQKPTAAEPGVRTYTCTVCGQTRTEAIPATGVPETCNGGPACPGYAFRDMPAPSIWSHAGLDYCIDHGYIAGTSATTVTPDGECTRAMIVSILYRVQGEPAKVNGYELKKLAAPFDDVERGMWYTDAIWWAKLTGVVSGMSPSTFAPDDPITRAQLAVILYNYTKQFAPESLTETGSLTGFPDAGSVPSWARTAMAWAVGNGLISGVGENGVSYLRPEGCATRAQVATILMNYDKALG